MIVLTYVLMILLLILGSIQWRKERKKLISDRMESVFRTQLNDVHEFGVTDKQLKQPFKSRVIKPFLDRILRSFRKNISEEQEAALEVKLLRAGSPFGLKPVEYRVVQILFIIFLPVLFGGYGLLNRLNFTAIMILMIIGFLVGKWFPNYYLSLKSKTRAKQAIKELPDFMDLVTVSIEAGLGFDAALSKVVNKKQGVLSTEFNRCLEEIRLGKTRRESLSGVRNRLNIDDIKSLIGSIIQAEQLGIGMVQILRVQSNEIRQRRKQRAEEAAMKAPIKMLFPLVLFIFPCLFIVLLGPAVIQVIQTFNK